MITATIAQLLHALRALRLELGERVSVVGEGETAHLAAQLAHLAGALSVRRLAPQHLASEAAQSADALVYGASDWSALGDALRLVRDRGRVLLLTEGGARVDFNLYLDIHRRSLQVIGAPDGEAEAHIVEFAQHLIESGKLAANGQRLNA
jgi:threonine dehydrogenase-like Zn-dependent dehydrogenase